MSPACQERSVRLSVCLFAAVTSSVRRPSLFLDGDTKPVRSGLTGPSGISSRQTAGQTAERRGAFPYTLTCLLALTSALGSRGDAGQNLSVRKRQTRGVGSRLMIPGWNLGGGKSGRTSEGRSTEVFKLRPAELLNPAHRASTIILHEKACFDWLETGPDPPLQLAC